MASRCSDLADHDGPTRAVRGRLRGLSWGNRPHFGADQPRRSMRWADVYVCMLADGVALRNRCPQGQADPRAAIAGGASGVTMARAGPHPRRARHLSRRVYLSRSRDRDAAETAADLVAEGEGFEPPRGLRPGGFQVVLAPRSASPRAS